MILPDFHISRTAVMFPSSTPRALPHFVHGVFLEKTKQKIVTVLESLDYLALNADTPVAKA